nr:hypothetical protein Itr_chr12CG13360 [Ipomoea trifida]GMD60195.1 hypothetical protein Iba_chr12aCG8790 [Ipomoea batatas]GMD63391.1 hypothetical protein Iba_chr12bCG14390 [Ipomoea batatas]GMD70503.1 hypothetical protein Iba_chr12eCG6930 [Ipomoea batatas]GMD72592.1 hypothetical protein Iba_chr12fCG10070 [Ipomoea batatas]
MTQIKDDYSQSSILKHPEYQKPARQPVDLHLSQNMNPQWIVSYEFKPYCKSAFRHQNRYIARCIVSQIC